MWNFIQRKSYHQNATTLSAEVHKDRSQDVSNTHHYFPHSSIPYIYKNTNEQNSSYNNDLNSSCDSILGSNDKLSDNGQNPDSWMYPIRRRGVYVPSNSFTDQGLSDGPSSRDSSDVFSKINRNSNVIATMLQNLLVEIRQAVNEAQPKVKNVMPQSLSPPGTIPWQQQSQQTTGAPSRSSMSSGSTSPGYSPSRVVDLSGSSTSFSSDRRSHNCGQGSVEETISQPLRVKPILSNGGECICEACNKKFTTKRKFRTHFRNSHIFDPVTCDRCNITYQNKSRLKVHNTCVHKPKRFQCEVCNFAFTHPHRLENHMRKHRRAQHTKLTDSIMECYYV